MIRCDGCGRHVRATDASCPFCARSSRRGAVAHKALQAMGGAATTVVLAACYGGPDMYKDSYPTYDTDTDTPATGLVTTGGGTITNGIDVSVLWTDADELDPQDTDANGANDLNCDQDRVELEIIDDLGVTSWEFGMVEVGTGGWTGEDCYTGGGGYQLCHPVSAPDHTLNEVCLTSEIQAGSTTLFDASKEPFLTYFVNDTQNGWCLVFGSDPSYYDALGCNPG